VTDAGSTKQLVCRAAREGLPRGRHFVGGHPIAGSHLTGPAHARADLFAGAPYVLTVDEGDADENEVARGEVAETLRRLGARVELMSARAHDRAMALVSHTPQLVSSALAAAVGEQPDADALRRVAGAGFADMTRLAASEWSVWRDIVRTNPSEIADALDAVALKLSAVRDELRAHAAGGPERLTLTGSLFEQFQTTSAVKG
jgi:prephenate dehydrogenase